MQNKKSLKLIIFIILALIICGLFVYFVLPKINSQVSYNSEDPVVSGDKTSNNAVEPIIPVVDPSVINPMVVTHVSTPKQVKALYISAWVAGSPKFRDSVIKIADETEINTIVIDVKDSTGRVSFEMPNPLIKGSGSVEKRIANVRALTDILHKKNIYIVGRISVFQDP